MYYDVFKLVAGATWKGWWGCRTMFHSFYCKSWSKLHWGWIKASFFCVSCCFYFVFMVLPRISSIVNKIGKAFTQLVLDENLDPTLFIIYLLLIIELNVSIHFSRHAGFNLVKMRSRGGGMPVAFADFEVSQLLLLIIKCWYL